MQMLRLITQCRPILAVNNYLLLMRQMLMLMTQCRPTLTVNNSLFVVRQMLMIMTQCRPTLTVNKSLLVVRQMLMLMTQCAVNTWGHDCMTVMSHTSHTMMPSLWYTLMSQWPHTVRPHAVTTLWPHWPPTDIYTGGHIYACTGAGCHMPGCSTSGISLLLGPLQLSVNICYFASNLTKMVSKMYC